MPEEKKQPVKEAKKQIVLISFDVPLNCPPISSGDKTISRQKNPSYVIDDDGDYFVITKKGMKGEARVHKSRANGWILQ